MNTKGILYIIPCLLGDTPVNRSIPLHNLEIIKSLDEFIVEDLRTARRFLIKAGINKPVDALTFYVLNEHSRQESMYEYLEPLLQGKNMGLLSDAGCPAIADPGAAVISLAHQKHIRVVPLVGPSSILLALIASGLNGQSFAFHGYLPKKPADRIKKLKQLETEAMKNGSAQIFIETPYRNDAIIKDMLNTLRNDILLCIASDITLPAEQIKTMAVGEWKKEKISYNDHPAVFMLGKEAIHSGKGV